MKLKRLLPVIMAICLATSPALAAVNDLSLPKSLKSIGAEAFMDTGAVERVTVKEGTLELGSKAFAGSSAKEIYLPESMNTIADDAFEDCNAQIFVVRNSYAHKWCVLNDANYAVVGEEETILYAVHSVQLSAAVENAADVLVTTDKACKLKTEVLSSDAQTVLNEKTVDVEENLVSKHILVEFGKTLPDSFILRTVLTDANGSELCEASTNRRYSSAYAEFENQSAADFPEADRIDFGDSGFAVLSGDVIKLNAAATRDSSGRYTFSSDQSLQAGDIVKLIVSGEETMVKIKSVSKNSDGSLTVVEDKNVYLSEIYDVINLDTNLVSGEVARGENIDEKKQVFSKDHSISVGAAELSAHTDMTVQLKFIYDKKKFGEDYFDIQLLADTSGQINVGLNGEVDTWKEDNAPAIQVYNSVVIIPGLSAPAFLNVSIPLNIKAHIAGNVNFGFSNHYGFFFNPDDGFSKTENGDANAEINIEGGFEVFAGPEISLTTSLFGMVTAKIGGQFGAKVTGEASKVIAGSNTADINTDKIHACQGCIDGDIYAQANLRATLLYELTEEVSGSLIDINIAAYTSEKLFDAFYSFKNDTESIYEGKKTFEMTECQNYKYRITGKTVGMDGKEKSGVPVTFSGAKIENTTKNSPHKIYLYPGDYHALAAFETGEVEMNCTVEKSAFGLILEEKETVIEGYVKDAETENPISGAKVVLVKPDGSTKTTTTNAEGYYRFDMLTGGTYTLKFSAASYLPDSFDNFECVIGAKYGMNMRLESSVLMDEEIVKKVLETMGPEMIKELKAGDIGVSFDFVYYVPAGEGPTYKKGQMQISVEIRSGIKSTWPSFTLDTDLYYAAQCAVYDSGVFNFSEADIEKFKGYYYPKSEWGRYYVEEYSEDGTNLHMNQTPSYEAITYVRHPNLKNDGNEKAWSSSWSFDKMTWASSTRP